MKKTALFALLVSAVVVTSCGNGSKPAGDSAAGHASDSLPAASLSTELAAVAAHFRTSDSWPYTTDSAKVDDITGLADSLSASEVKQLAQHWTKHALTDPGEWDTKEFYKIDSLKDKKAYGKYTESLDIGMTKYANAYALNKLTPDPKTTILVWGLWTSSYEACPFSDDKSVYCTVIRDGQVGETFLLARQMSAGDAPVSMGERDYGQLDKEGKLLINSRVENDEGEGTIVIQKTAYTAQLTDGKLGAISETKEKPVTKTYKVE